MKAASLEQDRKRFDSKVNKTETCWEWTSGLDIGGYGRFKSQGKEYKAHRWYWIQNVGLIPKGLVLHHKCDNPKCVRIEHLETGTHRDNTQDRIQRGRDYKGEDNPNAKLTLEQVKEIYRRIHAGEKIRNIVSEFHVSKATCWGIRHYKNWKERN